jgi:tetratricopeptide (TPR) repeat protein
MNDTTSARDTTDSGNASPPEARQGQETRGLKRILWLLAAFAGIAVVSFAVIYYLGQRPEPRMSLTEKSVVAAEEAVRQQPNDLGARLVLAKSYAVQGQNDDALAQYREVIKAQKNNRTALMGAAGLLYKKQDLAGARDYFQDVVDISGGQEFSSADPELEEAYYFLGRIGYDQGDFTGALKSLEAAVQIDKTDADAWNALGNVQVKLANYDKSVAAYKQALDFVPAGWCDPYAGLAVAYAGLNNVDGKTYASAMTAICSDKTEDGIAQLTSLAKTGEFQLDALLGLGLANETNGQPAQAVTWYKKVIELDPANVAALTALARLGSNDKSAPATNASPTPSASAS